MKNLPSEFKKMLLKFKPAFTNPSFDNFITLVCGWILCTTDHFITRLFRFGEKIMGTDKHHSTYYWFLKNAIWNMDQVSKILFHMAVSVVPGEDLIILVDDTLCRRSGPHIWGLGVFYDPVASSYGRTEGVKEKKVYSTGHSWVIMSLWIPFPWNRERGIGLPFLFRMYRSKKQTSEKNYKKQTELATEMYCLLVDWVPEEKKIYFVGDYQYSGKTFAGKLGEGTNYIGPMVKDAGVYEPDPEYGGFGRPPEKGKKIASPEQLAEDQKVPWKEAEVKIYGEELELRYKSKTVLWWDVTREEPVKMIVVRDPKGELDDRAYYCTDPSMSVEEIIKYIARRWKAEVMHWDVKGHLGIQEPRNGYVQRREEENGQKDPKIREDREGEQDKAAKRTVPLGLVVYSLVVMWYLENGSKEQTLERKKKQASYWSDKKHPTFADMLEELRKEIWEKKFLPDPVQDPGVGKRIRSILPFLSAA